MLIVGKGKRMEIITNSLSHFFTDHVAAVVHRLDDDVHAWPGGIATYASFVDIPHAYWHGILHQESE